jgi:hypothetical protein
MLGARLNRVLGPRWTGVFASGTGLARVLGARLTRSLPDTRLTRFCAITYAGNSGCRPSRVFVGFAIWRGLGLRILGHRIHPSAGAACCF